MYCVVLCTASNSEAETIASALVENKLCACINLIPGVKSFFQWKGRLEVEKESLLIIKTETRMIDRLIDEIKKLHSYEVPEIIALPITDGYNEYLNWIGDSLT